MDNLDIVISTILYHYIYQTSQTWATLCGHYLTFKLRLWRGMGKPTFFWYKFSPITLPELLCAWCIIYYLCRIFPQSKLCSLFDCRNIFEDMRLSQKPEFMYFSDSLCDKSRLLKSFFFPFWFRLLIAVTVSVFHIIEISSIRQLLLFSGTGFSNLFC